MISRFLAATILVAVAASFAWSPAVAAGTAAAHRHGGPTLRFTSKPHYQLAVQGSGWPALQPVTFSLGQGDSVFGLELAPAKNGTFIVGVNNIDLCNGDAFVARDLKGDRANLQGPGLGCPVSQNPPMPILTVVRGHQIKIAMTHVDTPTRGKPVVIRLADALYLWEPGITRPGFLPSAPSSYFALIGRGLTPPRACPEVECSAGFFWEWAGMRVGQTGIAMTPSCYPKCEIASYDIPVKIVTREFRNVLRAGTPSPPATRRAHRPVIRAAFHPADGREPNAWLSARSG